MRTRIVRRVDEAEFARLLEKRIVISDHALWHLSAAQRPSVDLRRTLLVEHPSFIGEQLNGNLALFFRRKSGFLKIIVAVESEALVVVTYLNVQGVPRC